MRRLLDIFRLEFIAIVRSWTLFLLLAASVAWTVAFPYAVKGDGTEEGLREMCIRYSLGGVFALLVVSLVASATGALARERAAKRLQLTLVRPVWPFTIALGKIVAYAVTGSLVMAVSMFVLSFRLDLRARCSHVLSPTMPSPQEEARGMYEAYMKDPSTPEAVKKAKKSVVLRLLTQKALDHYQTIPTNRTESWAFAVGEKFDDGVSVRMRFTNTFEMRQELRGVFRLGEREGVVSNITQAVLTVPLHAGGRERGAPGELTFRNLGATSLMIRPRKDLNLLLPADALWVNLVRAWLELTAVLTLVIAFGLFLSASLSRPVALFVALVTLIVGEMSPSVIEQYPDALETSPADRIGLMLTRFSAEVTRPLSELSPLEKLSKGECVEMREVLRTMGVDCVAIPLLLALISALTMPRKQDDLV